MPEKEVYRPTLYSRLTYALFSIPVATIVILRNHHYGQPETVLSFAVAMAIWLCLVSIFVLSSPKLTVYADGMLRCRTFFGLRTQAVNLLALRSVDIPFTGFMRKDTRRCTLVDSQGRTCAFNTSVFLMPKRDDFFKTINSAVTASGATYQRFAQRYFQRRFL